MAESPHIPTLTDIGLLPRWAKVLFLSRCSARVIPLILSQWPDLPDSDMMTIGMAGANADASSRLGREIHVGADPLPRLLELIQAAEQNGNMAAWGLMVSATAADLAQVDSAESATSLVATALERMIQAYAANRLNEGAVVGSVWFDFTALRDAAAAGKWNDLTRMPDGVLGGLWPHGPPPGWPAD
jgi:hypothetical protein